MNSITLRPHHGMCLAFYQGKGYDESFAVHMGEVKETLDKGMQVRLTVGIDEICSHCPNNGEDLCNCAEKTTRYDNRVLSVCGLHEGVELSYSDFQRLVQERILLAGKRREICGDCEWDEICN